MAKTGNLNMRIDLDLKEQLDSLFSELGITTTDAINMFFKQALLYNGLPFDVRLPEPNAATKQAMFDLDNNINVKTANSADELFQQLGINDAKS